MHQFGRVTDWLERVTVVSNSRNPLMMPRWYIMVWKDTPNGDEDDLYMQVNIKSNHCSSEQHKNTEDGKERNLRMHSYLKLVQQVF